MKTIYISTVYSIIFTFAFAFRTCNYIAHRTLQHIFHSLKYIIICPFYKIFCFFKVYSRSEQHWRYSTHSRQTENQRRRWPFLTLIHYSETSQMQRQMDRLMRQRMGGGWEETTPPLLTGPCTTTGLELSI